MAYVVTLKSDTMSVTEKPIIVLSKDGLKTLIDGCKQRLERENKDAMVDMTDYDLDEDDIMTVFDYYHGERIRIEWTLADIYEVL